MSDMVERLRLQAEIGLFDAVNVPGHVVASYGEAAAEIERLTAERDAALAKLAQYEQAPVVYANADRLALVRTYGGAAIWLQSEPDKHWLVPLIARPEAKP